MLKDFEIVTTSTSPYQKEFVSNFEHKTAPVYAMQFHAEKPLFEWVENDNINHSRENVRAMQFFADFMVDEASVSNHKFSNATDEYYSLIYNYSPQYSEKYSSFDQIYWFGE